jgi:protein-S-isoprenylcysteine O-methyltransferase Ste14
MPEALVRLAVRTVTAIAFARVAWVLGACVRTELRRKSLVATRWGWIERVTLPEPLVLGAVTYALSASGAPSDAASAMHAGAALLGAAVAVAGVGLTIWAFFSLPTVATGHYVLRSQPIVERGVYAWLRHPIYLGAFFIWLALALAYRSLLPLLVLVLYVIPAYLLYIREEERLMIEWYGRAYGDYRERVGGLLPRWRTASRSSRSAPRRSAASARGS